LLLAVPLLALIVSSHGVGADKEKAKVDPAAVERARKNVRVLDDVYKSTIVLITDKYVNTKKDMPAGRAAVNLFKQISDKGWHEVRLIDATGTPYNAKNVARDDFDKEGLKQLKSGKGYYEQVEYKDSKPYLRAITPVPVVMEKCIMCHDHYKEAKKGEAIGALTYTMPIE
jgi:hypothetical protein